MRRVLAVVLAAVGLLGIVVVDASAQPPAPTTKVTISGFMDNISSWTRNMSNVDLNYSRARDTEWYARTRTRPDITAELGTTKFVLGLEIDSVWGQTGSADSNALGGAPQRAGATSGWDLNTDTQAIIEIKWAYTEFDFPGIPMKTRVRLGAQPWAETYKLAVLANGDFPGAKFVMDISPVVRLHVTYAQVEEESTGSQDGFVRGDDLAFITSVEIMPFKGFDIRPIFAFFHADGITSGAARQGRGGVANALVAGGATGFYGGGSEDRYTLGADARLRFGPINVDPTFLLQWGTRELQSGVTGARAKQDMWSWLADLRVGFQAGPILLEAAAVWSPGNSAGSDVRSPGTDVKFYQPISTDTSYYATWAEHMALGIDYFNIINNTAAGLNQGVAIGYDKYGIRRLGARASYNVTPAFTLRAATTFNWTDEKVDTSSTKVAATGLTPGDFRGDSRYLGTEVDLGVQWRFAPGVAFDLVGAYTFTGEAMEAALSTNSNTGVATRDRDPKDIQTITARVRYSF
jgi:hypothetical protein